MTEWKCYLPGNGETRDDAWEIDSKRRIYYAKQAAEIVCKAEWSNSAGEIGFEPYGAVIVAPDGKETRWTLYSEPTIAHYAMESE